MKTLFRVLVLASIAAAGAALLIPFEHPHSITVELYQPPPAWLLGALLGIVAGLLLPVSSLGLLTFRRWSRPLSKLGTLLAAIAVAAFLSNFPPERVASPVAQALLVLSAAAWLGALLLSHHKQIGPQFRPER